MMMVDHDMSYWRNQIFEKKKNGGSNLAQMCRNRAQYYVLCHFLKFGSLVSLEIAYSNSFQQCITSSRGKTHEKI